MSPDPRAYVHVESAEIRWGGRNADKPRITLSCTNTGQTPAKWFEIKSVISEGAVAESRTTFKEFYFDRAALDKVTPNRWSALGGHGSLRGPVSLTDPELTIMKNSYGKKGVGLYVYGTVRYETMFDEIFETEFWFGGVDISQYKTSDPVGAPKDGLATYGLGVEIPIELKQGKLHLDAYKKVNVKEKINHRSHRWCV